MKTRNYFIAASIMVAAIALAIVSCKKETANTLNQKANETQAFDFRQINDMNAYLANFKAKMFESKSDEAYSLNDAAWHLASLANRDFCNASIKYDNVQFDTVKMNVTITDGTVLLTDLGAAYEQMCTIIRQFKSGFTHDNQILYFINMFINADGNARIALMTTYATPVKDLDDHHWYFPDIFGYVDSVCLYHFESNTQYLWNGYGKEELQRILNLFESHAPSHGMTYITPTRSFAFEYPNWTDSYGSPFNYNSRLCATYSENYTLTEDEMCYCLDSYLGLGYDYITNNYYCDYEHPVLWTITTKDSVFQYNNLRAYYHILTVQYGQIYHDGTNPSPDI